MDKNDRSLNLVRFMSMAVYVLSDWRPADCTAYKKAPDDVTNILLAHGARILRMPINDRPGWLALMVFRLRWLARMFVYAIVVKRRSVFLVQWPSFPLLMGNFVFKTLVMFARLKRICIVTLIHDVGRESVVRETEKGCCHDGVAKMLEVSDAIITHNKAMTEWLVERGFRRERMVELEIFDYLMPGYVPRQEVPFARVVSIAGNLTREKAGYVYGLKDCASVKWELFGKGLEDGARLGENVIARGVVSPEELPHKFTGCFGLVWDGPSMQTCEGVFGLYMKINSPHKLSLYLAAGLPVIIWSGAAQADLVKRYNVGLVVDSLPEIEGAMSALTGREYGQMRQRVLELSRKLREGGFTWHAVCDAVRDVDCVSR